MLTIYVCTLVGVAVAILGLLIDSLWGVTRKPHWELPRTRLVAVESSDRRGTERSFVGTDRRAADAPSQEPARKTA